MSLTYTILTREFNAGEKTPIFAQTNRQVRDSQFRQRPQPSSTWYDAGGRRTRQIQTYSATGAQELVTQYAPFNNLIRRRLDADGAGAGGL
ncbi:MAG: hypothetical protein ACYC6Y_14780 [Thermoguttaceae bacterium]